MNAGGAVLVLNTFAAVWWVVGFAGSGRGSPLTYTAGIGLSALFVIIDRLRTGTAWSPPAVRRHRGRVVGVASAAEGVAILVAAMILTRLDRRDLIAPVVASIVGLHFLPLARWLPAPLYYWTGALLVVVGMIGAGVQDLPTRFLVVGVSAAFVLWLSTVVVLARLRVRNP